MKTEDTIYDCGDFDAAFTASRAVDGTRGNAYDINGYSFQVDGITLTIKQPDDETGTSRTITLNPESAVRFAEAILGFYENAAIRHHGGGKFEVYQERGSVCFDQKGTPR